jgi:hypothetical protein
MNERARRTCELTLVAGEGAAAQALAQVLSTLVPPCHRAERSRPPAVSYLLVVAEDAVAAGWMSWSRRLAPPARIVVLGERCRAPGSLHLRYREDLTCRSWDCAIAAVLTAARLVPRERGPMEDLVSAVADVNWHGVPARVQDVRGRLEDALRSASRVDVLSCPAEWEAICTLGRTIHGLRTTDIAARLGGADLTPELARLLELLLGEAARDALRTVESVWRALRDRVPGPEMLEALDSRWQTLLELKKAGDEARNGPWLAA